MAVMGGTKLRLVFADAVVARESEGVGKKTPLALGTETIFEASVYAVLEIVGGKVFCFFDGGRDVRVQVAFGDVVGVHVGEARVCEDVDAGDEAFADGDRPAADGAGFETFHVIHFTDSRVIGIN
jgi:hypothetical protein